LAFERPFPLFIQNQSLVLNSIKIENINTYLKLLITLNPMHYVTLFALLCWKWTKTTRS